ncbi:MAG: hypothetical protein HKN09_12450 [Saprospiraceae bacterium]|nr:hypothetical protein [Saprospiraceae bacterium]
MSNKPKQDKDTLIDIEFYRSIGLLITAVSVILISIIIFFFYIAFKDDIEFHEARAAQNKQAIVLEEDDFDKVENGIHVATGLAYDDNFQVVRSACVTCHSAQLIIQNRATKEGWLEIIRWMQATQGLADLGDKEPQILDYLAKHYAPKETGRRPNLDMASIEWYTLSLD